MLKSVWRPAVSVAGLAVIAGFAFGSAAQAESIQKQCSEKYQSAKAANSLNGETWNQFYKQCAAELKGGGAATTTSAPPPQRPRRPRQPRQPRPRLRPRQPRLRQRRSIGGIRMRPPRPAPLRLSRAAMWCSPTRSHPNIRASRPGGRGSRLATTNIAPTRRPAETAASNGSRRAAAITASATSTLRVSEPLRIAKERDGRGNSPAFVFQGISTVAPVVARDSSASCTATMSASGRVT